MNYKVLHKERLFPSDDMILYNLLDSLCIRSFIPGVQHRIRFTIPYTITIPGGLVIYKVTNESRHPVPTTLLYDNVLTRVLSLPPPSLNFVICPPSYIDIQSTNINNITHLFLFHRRSLQTVPLPISLPIILYCRDPQSVYLDSS